MGRKQLSEDERLAQMHIGVPYKWKYDNGLRQFLKEKIKHYTSMNTIKLLALAIFISSCSKDDELNKKLCLCELKLTNHTKGYDTQYGKQLTDCNGNFLDKNFNIIENPYTKSTPHDVYFYEWTNCFEVQPNELVFE